MRQNSSRGSTLTNLSQPPVDGVPVTEKDKFLHLLNIVYTHGKYEINCPNSSKARNLRRKFYRLRDSLVDFDRQRAQFVEIKVAGHFVILENKTSWADSITLPGELVNVRTETGSPELPGSDRLDDPS